MELQNCNKYFIKKIKCPLSPRLHLIAPIHQFVKHGLEESSISYSEILY